MILGLADFASSMEEGSKGKQKPSKVESARSYFDLDHVDAISSDKAVNPVEENYVIQGDQNTTSNFRHRNRAAYGVFGTSTFQT